MTFSGLLSVLGNHWYIAVVAALIAYLLGSINTAVIVTKIVTKGKGDIREMGSKNAGFTNVLRSVGKVPAIFTIVCDFLKSIVATTETLPVLKIFSKYSNFIFSKSDTK